MQAALSNHVVQLVEWLADFRSIIPLAVLAYFAATLSDQRYRYGAVALAAAYVLWISVAYVRALRRDLDCYVMPRRVSTRQAQKLAAALKREQTYPIKVNVDPQDAEAREYAAQLFNAFRQGGWDAEFNTMAPYDPNEGLRINVTGINNPQGAYDPREAIQRAFNRAGIQPNGGGGTGAGEFRVNIAVGRRPLIIIRRESLLSKLGRILLHLGQQRY